MSSVLDIAASYLFENLPSVNESFHDESVDQAKKYIENNYEELYTLQGFGELSREKPTDIKAFAAKKIRDIQELIVYPLNYGTRNEFKWLNSYVLGLTRLLYTEFNYDKPKFKSTIIPELRKVYLAAVYARQDGNQKGDKSLLMDKNMNGLSFSELKTKFMPLYDKYYKIYLQNKAEYIESKKNGEQGNKTDSTNTDIKYDGAGNVIDMYEPPYHNDTFKVGKYNVCMIPDHKAAATWNKLTNKTSNKMGCNWCITIPDSASNWINYGCGVTRTVYFCWTDNFLNLNVKDFNDGSAPYNEWGKSLICVMVNSSNDIDEFIQQVTSRYNHCDGTGKEAQSSLGFGDNFCGQAGSSGQVNELAKLFDCTPEEIQNKLVYTGKTYDDDGEEEKRHARFANAMESVEYYLGENRFSAFEIASKLPDNYAILQYYDHTYDIKICILFDGEKPVENFMYESIQLLYRGKTIDECIFKVENKNDSNIVIGPNINPIFGYAFDEILPMYQVLEKHGYKFNTQFEDISANSNYVYCSIKTNYGDKCNFYDLKRRHFVLPESIYLLSIYESDGNMNIIGDTMPPRRKISDTIKIYDITNNTAKGLPENVITELNEYFNDPNTKSHFLKGYIVDIKNDDKLLYDLYNMRPFNGDDRIFSNYMGYPEGYMVSATADNQYHTTVYYKGKKIDEFTRNDYTRLVDKATNILHNDKALIFVTNHDKTQKVYNDGKLVYEETNEKFNDTVEPFVIGNMLLKPADWPETNVSEDTVYCYTVMNMKTGKEFEKIYFSPWELNASCNEARHSFIGYKINEEKDKVSLVFVNDDDTVTFLKEQFDKNEYIDGIATISSGDCELIVIGGEMSMNSGSDTKVLDGIEFHTLNPMVYKKDGTRFFDESTFKQETAGYKDLSFIPLGYGYWLLRRETNAGRYGHGSDSIIFDRDGNILIGNNKNTEEFYIELLHNFSNNKDLEFYVTYKVTGSYNETSPTYALSKDGNLHTLKNDANESLYILNRAAMLLG